MEISARAQKRFCKDCGIAIRIFHEPYFTDRPALFDKFYGTLDQWELFVSELSKYHCEHGIVPDVTDINESEILSEDGSREIEFKCLDNYVLPFVLRKFLGEEIAENDKVFYHEGLLAKYIEIPLIICYNKL